MADDAGTSAPGGAGAGSRLARLLPYLLPVVGVLGGLAWLATHHFKRGSGLIAVSLLLGAVLRLLLPESRAGLLAVRSKALDVLALASLGVAIALVAYKVPPPS